MKDIQPNGPVIVNGFIGDAVFCDNCTEESEISDSLTTGLVLYTAYVQDGETYRNRLVADVGIRIGSQQYETVVQMTVLNTLSHPDSQVIFGKKFMEQHGVDRCINNCNRIHSPYFGEVAIGILRPFWKITTGMCIDARLGYVLPYSSLAFLEQRVIMLLDMDAFEVQVHQKNYPESISKPTVVANSSGRVVAVSYEAKQLGINRNATPTVAQVVLKSEEVFIIYIPERSEGRVDTSIARMATNQIVDSVKAKQDELKVKHDADITFEYSSGDEFYLDVTQVVDKIIQRSGWWPNMNGFWPNTLLYEDDFPFPPEDKLITVKNWIGMIKDVKSSSEEYSLCGSGMRILHGAVVANKIIRAILRETGFQSSVGIGCNKIMAKIASGLHKPGSVTVVLPSGFKRFSQEICIEDIPGLGGKRGDAIKSTFNIERMAELQLLTTEQIADVYFGDSLIGPKAAVEIVFAANGFCLETVKEIDCSKSLSLSQQLNGRAYRYAEINVLMTERLKEMEDRVLEDGIRNQRWPKEIKVVLKVDGVNLSFVLSLPPASSSASSLVYNPPDLARSWLKSWHGSEISRHWKRFNRVTEIKMNVKFE